MSLLKILLVCSCLVVAGIAAHEEALKVEEDTGLTEGSGSGAAPDTDQQMSEPVEDPESTSDDIEMLDYDAMESDTDTDSEAATDTSDDDDWMYEDYKFDDAMLDDATSSSSDTSDSDNEYLQPPSLH